MNVIKIKRATASGATPSSLEDGELALQQFDRRGLYKDAAGILRPFFFSPVAFTVEIPFPARPLFRATINDALVRTSSIVRVMWDDVLDTDENDPELVDVIFKTKCNNGSFDLTIVAQGRQLIGGTFKLMYQIL